MPAPCNTKITNSVTFGNSITQLIYYYYVRIHYVTHQSHSISIHKPSHTNYINTNKNNDNNINNTNNNNNIITITMIIIIKTRTKTWGPYLTETTKLWTEINYYKQWDRNEIMKKRWASNNENWTKNWNARGGSQATDWVLVVRLPHTVIGSSGNI